MNRLTAISRPLAATARVQIARSAVATRSAIQSMSFFFFFFAHSFFSDVASPQIYYFRIRSFDVPHGWDRRMTHSSETDTFKDVFTMAGQDQDFARFITLDDTFRTHLCVLTFCTASEYSELVTESLLSQGRTYSRDQCMDIRITKPGTGEGKALIADLYFTRT